MRIIFKDLINENNLNLNIASYKVLDNHELDKIQLLYSETHGRYIMTVKADALDDILSKIDVDVEVIGEVKGNSLRINNHEFSFDDLNDAYHGVIEKYMA